MSLTTYAQHYVSTSGTDSIISSRRTSAEIALKKLLENDNIHLIQSDIQSMMATLLLVFELPETEIVSSSDINSAEREDLNAINNTRRRREEERRQRDRDRQRRSRREEVRLMRTRYRRKSEEDNPNENVQ